MLQANHRRTRLLRTVAGRFHMGESGESESLARYKEKFGARPIPYAEHRIEHLPATSIATSARTVVKRAIGFRDT